MGVVHSITIRVLLEKKPIEETMLWNISARKADGFIIQAWANEQQKHEILAQRLEIANKQGCLYINGKKVKTDKVIIRPLRSDGYLSVNERVYPGLLILLHDEHAWYLINKLDLESYVYCVLRWEGRPDWADEVNKVFSIVFRTYAVHKMIGSQKLRKRGKKVLYDIKCTNAHQTYNGLHEYTNMYDIVKSTEGLVITYNKVPINAMYDICCGGIIPALMQGFDFHDSPYLARRYPCTYCNSCRVYQWEAVYENQELSKIVALYKNSADVEPIRNIVVSRFDKAGLVQELKVYYDKMCATLSAKQLYSIFTKIKSLTFTVNRRGNNFVFSGKGIGHQCGMCQCAVPVMIKKGFDCCHVLQFYYPSTALMKVVSQLTGA
jgi:stage II sporulation protein D